MTERCCNACRTPFHGVCREKHECWCHLEQRAKNKDTGRRPVADPTGNTAVANITREQRKRDRGRRQT